MIDFFKDFNNKLYILGASCTNYEIDQKYKWLAIYYPYIKKENVIFICSSEYKTAILKKYCRKLNYTLANIFIGNHR